MPLNPSPTASPHLSAAPSVLVVDPSADSREVLRTGLHRCGLETIEATHAAHAAALIDQHHPRIVVLDVEPDGDAFADQSVLDDISHEAAQHDASIVVLGHVLPSHRESVGNLTGKDDSAASQFFSKPYQYAAVIRKIEELVRQSPN